MKHSSTQNVSSIPRMRRVQSVHFVGIGGAGMCGIAEVMLHEGYEVSGSDLVDNGRIARLRELGVAVNIGHYERNVKNADVVVASTAIPSSNVEIVRAHDDRVPVVSRAQMLGELLRHRYGIAVAGTHGKTTTTSLITSIFQVADWNPTYVIGGLLKKEGRYAHLGQSRYLIAEADESDASFLYLNPMATVICNIDHDHLGTYNHDYRQLLDAFVDFVHRLPFYGLAVVCIDDPGVKAIEAELARPIVTYGISDEADYRAIHIEHTDSRCRFTAVRPDGKRPLDVSTCLPGIDNVRNILGAIAIASDEGVPDHCIIEGLENFQGIDRRFEIEELNLGGKRITMIDDYGHHPREIEHMVNTTRELYGQRRLVMIYQPHRFTRTRDLFDDFVSGLSMVDLLVIVDTYAASENPIEGASAQELIAAIQEKGKVTAHYAHSSNDGLQLVKMLVQNEDVLLVQGAGNVDQVSSQLKMVPP